MTMTVFTILGGLVALGLFVVALFEWIIKIRQPKKEGFPHVE